MSVCWHPGHPHCDSGNGVYNVGCNICPCGIDASVHCEVGAERSSGRRRTAITLAKVESHRTCSRGSETQTPVRAGERRFTNLRSTAAATTLRRNRCLVNEGVAAALRTTVRPRTLGGIWGVLEKRPRGRSRNRTWRTGAKTGSHRMEGTNFRTGHISRVNQNRLLRRKEADQLLWKEQGKQDIQ